MKIIIIDNYDSFTFNLYHYIKPFTKQCEVVKIDKIDFESIKNYDKIVLSPGPGLPKEQALLSQVIDSFYKTHPILGICLGHQAIAEFFGAKLINMKEVHHGIQRDTDLFFTKEEYLWANLPNTIASGRYHSWAVDAFNLPPDLEIIASDKNNNNIMALRHKIYDIRAIQFHPESILTPKGRHIIGNWVNNPIKKGLYH